MNKEIENYINSKVLPLYENNDESHSLSHINNVINYSLQLGKKYNLKEDILYIISAYHDVGVFKDRDIHEIISAEYSFLLTYFPQKRIIISEMGNHRQESSCQTVENFIFRRVPAR